MRALQRIILAVSGLLLAALQPLAVAAVVTLPLQATTGSERMPSAADNKGGPVAVANPPTDRSKDCDAACLKGLADRYLDALAKRDYTGLPVSPNLLVAENSHATRIGEGLWKVLEKLNLGRAWFTDPVQGQVVVITTLQMSAQQPYIFLLRIRAEGRLISEVESMVTADLNAAQHFRPDNLENFDPVTLATVPAAQRLTREQLIAASRTMWYGSGTPITAGEGCVHWENGDKLLQFRCGTSEVVQPGGMGLNYTNRAQRDAVIDEEKGVVVSFTLKDTLPYLNPNPPDYERTPLFYQRPLTLYLATVLKYEMGNKLTAQHIFMNAQEANVPAVFVR